MSFFDDDSRRQDWEWIGALGVGLFVVKSLERTGKSLGQMLSEFMAPPSMVRPDSLPSGAGMPNTGNPLQVQAVRTAYDIAGVHKLISDAITEVGLDNAFPNVDARENLIACMLAHIDIETRTFKAIWNYNVGNIRYFKQGGQFYVLNTSQGPISFVAYNFPLQGATDYVSLLDRKYNAAIRAGALGDPKAFAEALIQGGYLGPKDDKPAYVRAIVSLYPKYRGRVSGASHPTLRLGDTGPFVREWQSVIGVTPDGIFGPITEARTEEWQAAHGLDDDGIVGPKTWAVALTRPPGAA